ncbi:MAG: GntR family transcriptional regulator [Pseudomonadota bacterium]
MTEMRRKTKQNHLLLAQKVLHITLERGMRAGEHLPEQAFSRACGVSRTPIRSAFKILENNSILSWREEAGYFLEIETREEHAEALRKLEGLEDSLAQRILSDRAERRIGEVQSASALVRRYNVSRSAVLNALKILSYEGIVSQLPGRSWAFQPILDSPTSVDESLAFRLTLEPQAILTPSFSMDFKRAGLLRNQMDDILKQPDGRITFSAFQSTDTEFHSFIAECSGNRFIRGALLAHHRLRRTTQKDDSIPDFRLRQSLAEHLEILDSLESKQFDLAADQMVLHLRKSKVRRPEAANRGIPPMKRGKQT